LMAAVALSGCGTMIGAAGEAAKPRPDIVIIPLTGIAYGAGEIGKAVLVAQGEKTAVTIEVSGVPDYVTRPVHLYTYIHRGTCGNLDREPVYSLDERVLASVLGRPSVIRGIGAKGPFTVANTAPVTLSALSGSPHAIAVQTSPADGSYLIFCGNIA
jgi:hypothetical protein